MWRWTATNEPVPDIGRAVVGRHADDARIEPRARADLLDERHTGMAGNDDIDGRLLPLLRDDRALGGEDEAVDQVDAAVDDAQPAAADVQGQDLRQLAPSRRRPRARCAICAAPALGEALAFAARLELMQLGPRRRPAAPRSCRRPRGIPRRCQWAAAVPGSAKRTSQRRPVQMQAGGGMSSSSARARNAVRARRLHESRTPKAGPALRDRSSCAAGSRNSSMSGTPVTCRPTWP